MKSDEAAIRSTTPRRTGSTNSLPLQTRSLILGDHDRNEWAIEVAPTPLVPAETALILCDVWDHHWSRGAEERVDVLAPVINDVVIKARAAGITIIHAPSDTMEFYRDSPARRRAQAAPPIDPPPEREHEDPPLPIDDSDGGSDTNETGWHTAWTRQHPEILIDEDQDAISDNGREIYSFLQQKGIRSVFLAGVHTNMCVLKRSFAIKQMVRWGVPIILIRDLTDAMYNPARSPYVSHEEGVRLVVEYIEKFWCPTVHSTELIAVL